MDVPIRNGDILSDIMTFVKNFHGKSSVFVAI
jgi:hypothetical protein